MKNYLIILLTMFIIVLNSCKSAEKIAAEEKSKKEMAIDTLVLATDTIEKYQLDSKKIIGIQYMTSDTMLLYYIDPSDSLKINTQVDQAGKLLIGQKKSADIVIPKGTQCVIDTIRYQSITVRFSIEASKTISFMPINDGIFYPNGKISNKVIYGGKAMFLDQKSLEVKLMFMKDELPQVNDLKTESGVTIANKKNVTNQVPQAEKKEEQKQETPQIKYWAPAGSGEIQKAQQETKPANQTPAKKGSNAFDVD